MPKKREWTASEMVTHILNHPPKEIKGALKGALKNKNEKQLKKMFVGWLNSHHFQTLKGAKKRKLNATDREEIRQAIYNWKMHKQFARYMGQWNPVESPPATGNFVAEKHTDNNTITRRFTNKKQWSNGCSPLKETQVLCDQLNQRETA